MKGIFLKDIDNVYERSNNVLHTGMISVNKKTQVMSHSSHSCENICLILSNVLFLDLEHSSAYSMYNLRKYDNEKYYDFEINLK